MDPLTRLLQKEEEEYDPEFVKKRRRVMAMVNKRLEEEERRLHKLGTCPICNVYLTITGYCPYGHVKE